MLNKTCYLAALLALTADLQAGVTFVPQFEAGSKWYSETWSADARAAMITFLNNVGNLFNSNASATININDNETVAYASAGSAWHTSSAVPWRAGTFQVPALWSIIVNGIDTNGAAADVNLNWNMDLGLYSGSSAGLINNFRGLGRHEMHHAFGASSFLGHSTTYDPRGTNTSGVLVDSRIRDLNDAPILGTYNSATGRFPVNAYTLVANWQASPRATGLYFEGRTATGATVKMPLYSSSTSIDFSHIVGISYTTDHPTWNTYVAEDFNFLRAMGYPLAVDAATDIVPPTLSISAPTNGSTTTTATSVFQGTAADVVGVTQVFVRVNGGAWASATGTTSWQASVPLNLGANTLDAYARDGAGNVSATGSVTVTLQGPPPDDHGNTTALASTAPATHPITGYLTSGDVDVFRIAVPGAGALIVSTEGGTDTYGVLQNSAGSTLAENDDNGAEVNFRLSQTVTTGNYYVSVRGYNAQTLGNYTLAYNFYPTGTKLTTTYYELDSPDFYLGFLGTNGTTYYVQTSTNLTAWSQVSTVVGNGHERYVSLPTPAGPRRYYRVSSNPAP